MKSNYKWALAAVALIVLIVVVDRTEDWVTHIEYPLNIWRMDLDDFLFNVGGFLMGLAAFMTVFKKAGRAQTQADKANIKVNGGMQKLAEEHVKIAAQEVQESGHYTELLDRITSLEGQRNVCLEELSSLRIWVERKLP